MFPLVSVAGSAVKKIGGGILLLNFEGLIYGLTLAGIGLKYSLVLIYRLIRLQLIRGWRIVAGPSRWYNIRQSMVLLPNVVLAMLGVVANLIVLVGPWYFLWEIFFAQQPILLPLWATNLASTILTWIFTLIVIWFFVEEFTAGPNQVFDLDRILNELDSQLESESDYRRRQSSNEDGRRLSPSTAGERLDAVEEALESDR